MSLKQFLQGEKHPQSLKIKVIEIHNDMSIVGDATALAICHNPNMEYKNMKVGQCYQILKPTAVTENEIMPNEKLKPIKINNFTVNTKKVELSKLQALMPSVPVPTDRNSDNLITFKDIETLPAKTEIKSITAKVINLSKDISGTYGKYCIGKLKDIQCNQMDINIYNMKLKPKMNIGEIIELKKVKVTEFVKDGNTVKRFMATPQTTVNQCSSNAEALFKDVPLGDKKEEGKVVAIHDIFTYLSCPKCWKKVADEDTSCACGSSLDNAINDFHCQFYIELTKDEFIEVVHTFRRQTDLSVQTLAHDDIQKLLNDTFLQKIFIFEWNFVDGDEEQLRMVKIGKPQEKDK